MKIQTWLVGGVMLGGLVSGSQAEQKILAQVEIRGLDRVAADVARLTETVGQPMPGEALLGLAGAALGSPDLTGLDSSGVFRLVVMASEGFPEEPPAVALMAPVTGDGQAYLDAVGQVMESAGEADGVHTFTQGANALPMGPPQMCIAPIEGGAVIGMEGDVVRQVAAVAAGLASPTEAELPGAVAVRVDVASLLALLEPMMDEKMGEMKEMLEQAEAPGQAAAPPTMQDMDVSKVLDAEVDLLLGMLKQLDHIGLGIGLAGDALQIHASLDPQVGSGFAAALASAHPPVAAIRTALPADALYAQTAFIPGIDAMIGPYVDFMVDLYAGMGPEVSQLAAPMLEMMKDLDGLYPGDYAAGVIAGENGAWPALIQVAMVTDTGKMKSFIDNAIAAQAQMFTTNLMGYTYSITTEVTRAHREVEITTYSMQMDFGEEMTTQLPPGFAEIFTDLRYDMAFVENMVVYTLGPSNAIEQAIDRLLDGSGEAVTQGAAFRSRFPALPQEPIDAFTIRIFDAVRAVLALLPKELGESVPPIPSSPGTVAGYSQLSDGGLRSTLAIGLEDIAAVGEMVQQAMPKPGGVVGGGPGSCTQNLRQLTILCYMHEAEAGALPTSWDALGAQLGGPSPLGPPALLVCPDAADKSVPSYRLSATGSLGDMTAPHTTPLVEEVSGHHGGKRHVAYADGHIELVD
jgi:prepilin-type processing-associated H-X9-DG protein